MQVHSEQRGIPKHHLQLWEDVLGGTSWRGITRFAIVGHQKARRGDGLAPRSSITCTFCNRYVLNDSECHAPLIHEVTEFRCWLDPQYRAHVCVTKRLSSIYFRVQRLHIDFFRKRCLCFVCSSSIGLTTRATWLCQQAEAVPSRLSCDANV